jgi:hypothetical protein
MLGHEIVISMAAAEQRCTNAMKHVIYSWRWHSMKHGPTHTIGCTVHRFLSAWSFWNWRLMWAATEQHYTNILTSVIYFQIHSWRWLSTTSRWMLVISCTETRAYLWDHVRLKWMRSACDLKLVRDECYLTGHNIKLYSLTLGHAVV